MPKINIKEIDNTQAPLRPYSNFSVVVPGFHAPYFAEADDQEVRKHVKGIILQKATDENTYEAQTDVDVFGLTGIREFTSVSEFEELVGIVAPKPLETTYEYECAGTVTREGETVSIEFIPFGAKEAVTITQSANRISMAPLTAITHEERNYTCQKADDVAGIEGKYIFTCEVETIIPAHYGNQIAYELLNMGYPVYFVNMGEFRYETLNNITNQGTDSAIYSYSEDPSAINQALKDLGDDDFWGELRDKTTYDYRFILTGLLESGDADTKFVYDYVNEANRAISTLADYDVPDNNDVFNHTKKRGDCIALIDLDEAAIERTARTGLREGAAVSTKKIVNAIKTEIQNLPATVNKYSAIFCSSVTYTNNSKSGLDGYNNSRFPASFHYLACFDQMLANNFKEWFAVAGFTRGVATYNIGSTRFDLGDLAVQALEPRYLDDKDANAIDKACNVIVRNLNNYYIWGNRTAHKLGKELTASHFLNVRQLCTTIKKYVYNLCRNYTFDPNSDVLWINFKVAVSELLESMKVNQGIRAYKISRAATALKGTLAATITIVPIEAVEDFDIELVLEDSIDGTSVTLTD